MSESETTSEGDDGKLPVLKLNHTIYNAHDQDVNCVKWHPRNPNVLASCSDDETVKIWAFDSSESIINENCEQGWFYI